MARHLAYARHTVMADGIPVHGQRGVVVGIVMSSKHQRVHLATGSLEERSSSEKVDSAP